MDLIVKMSLKRVYIIVDRQKYGQAAFPIPNFFFPKSFFPQGNQTSGMCSEGLTRVNPFPNDKF